MKQHTSIAAKAIAAGLALTMALGPVAAPVAAFAADGTATQGDITIKANTHVSSDTTTLLGYQLFKADVADQTVGATTSKAVSNIVWGSTQAQTAVEAAIKAVEPTYAGTSAQDAADWLSEHASGSGSATVVDANDAFGKIAAAMRTAGAAATTITPGTKATLDEGYWLFVTDSNTTSDPIDKVGTAPIYAVVGGSAVTVDQKSSLPTVNKFIKNDATGSDWAKAADSQIGQNVDYKLTGTVATALASYDTYYYSFSDVLSSGLTADSSSVKVMVQNPATGDAAQTETQVRADDYTVSLDSDTNTLTVTINDLKTVKDTNGNAIAITSNSVVNVYYTAKLNNEAMVASNSNDNTVTLTYSNNPGTNDHGYTTPATVRDYTYQLMLMKVDSSDNSKGLKGAKFTIQATGADEGAGKKYVQGDGKLGDAAYEFTSKTDGSISVSGLDAGEYTVVETQAPEGYNTVPSFTFQIYPVYKTTGDIDTIRVQTSNGNVSTINVYDGVIDLVIKDKAGMSLPLTGQAGVTLTWVAGGVVLAFGITHLVRSRKRDENSAE
ncbi:isopeptide-forming domain-containing fimbrial protein [Collinsella sp. HCP28S3_E12]|uniref:isopeptide-forming domain-containing fimbrial protein n=1 Tax=unclassified Collinsella TaxID=2637548 RepID=UPI003F8C243D